MHWLLSNIFCFYGGLLLNKPGSDIVIGQISWRSAPPLWLTILVIIPAVFVFAFWLYKKEKATASFTVKVFLTILRSAVIIIALLVIFQPVIITEKPITKETIIPILIDNSLSMSFKDKYSDQSKINILNKLKISPDKNTPSGFSRIELVNAALTNQELDIINKINNPDKRRKARIYSFSSSLKPLNLYLNNSSQPFPPKADQPLAGRAEARPSGMDGFGESTAIGNTIAELASDLSRQPALAGGNIGAIVIFSDGRNNYGKNPVDAVQPLISQGIPVYTVLAGNTEAYFDLELLDLTAPDLAVVNDIISFNFTIKTSAKLPEQNNIKVNLMAQSITNLSSPSVDGLQPTHAGRTGNEKLLVAEDVISPNQFINGIFKGTLNYKPTKAGDYLYELKIHPLKDEIIEENNSLQHIAKVVDDVIKVLYVESFPRWEYRRLKNALIRDNTIQAAMFLISADPDFPQESSPNILPLTQFPAEARDLFQYDVIIWGDVSPEYLATPQVNAEKLTANLKRFVDEMGGGVAFICGDFFNPKSPALLSGLGGLLPLVPANTLRDAFLAEQKPAFSLEATTEGLSDPLLQAIIPVIDKTNLHWFFPFVKAKPAARVLARHPNGSPLIATQFYGQGKTFIIATDETWRFITTSKTGASIGKIPSGAEKTGQDEKYFYGFWREIIRFLRGGNLTGTKNIRLFTDKPKYTIGETVKITAKIYDADFKPLKQPTYELSLTQLPQTMDGQDRNGGPPEGSVFSERAGPDKKITLQGIPDKEGLYEYSLTADSTGFYKLNTLPAKNQYGQDSPSHIFFAVNYSRLEFENPLPDLSLMKTLAEKTNGVFFDISEIDKLPDAIKPASDVIYTETKEDDLWDSPWVFVIFLLVISAEWIVRKLIGLI